MSIDYYSAIIESSNIARLIVESNLENKRLGKTEEEEKNKKNYNSIVIPAINKFKDNNEQLTPSLLIAKFLKDFAEKNGLINNYDCQGFHYKGQIVKSYVWGAITKKNPNIKNLKFSYYPQLYITINQFEIRFGFGYGDNVDNNDECVDIIRSNTEIVQKIIDIVLKNPNIKFYSDTSGQIQITKQSSLDISSISSIQNNWFKTSVLIGAYPISEIPSDIITQIEATFGSLIDLFTELSELQFVDQSNLYENLKPYIKYFLENRQEIERYNTVQGFPSLKEQQEFMKREIPITFSMNNIQNLDKETYHRIIAGFITVDNWHPSKTTSEQKIAGKQYYENIGFDEFKNRINSLLYGTEQFQERFLNIRKKTTHLGPSILSELLCYRYPNEYPIYNSPSKRALKNLNLISDSKIDSTGKDYLKYIQTMNNLLETLRLNENLKDADFCTVETFLLGVEQMTSQDDESSEKFQYENIADQKITNIHHFNKQVILYGPPGTGKTYNSVIRAHEIIFGDNDPNITFSVLQNKLKANSKKEIDYSQLSWADALVLAFEEIGIHNKALVSDIKNTEIIKKVINFKNSQSISNTIWFFLQKESKIDSLTVKLKNKSGREYFDKDVDSHWFLTDKGREYLHLLSQELTELPTTSVSQFNFITFHQSFAYEDFIEGIRPAVSDSEDSSITYRIKDGIFKEICKKAGSDPDNNYVLIIDEINRGNISKIFGELITLLEDNKRAGEKEEVTVKLPYSGQEFSVPLNVYIIGTMNSTDKSIALVDIAIRRRFHFERLNVDYELIPNKEAKAFLQELNSIIRAIKNPDYEIGHYYFMNVPVIDDENHELEKVFSTRILPLLEEYFFNDWEALATILGRDSIHIEMKRKVVWDEDTGRFEDESGDSDKIYGLSLKETDLVFTNTMKNLGIYSSDRIIS